MKYYLNLLTNEEYHTEGLLKHEMNSCFSHGHIKIIKRTKGQSGGNTITTKDEYKYAILSSIILLPLTLVQAALILIYNLLYLIKNLAIEIQKKINKPATTTENYTQLHEDDSNLLHNKSTSKFKKIFQYAFAIPYGITAEIKWFLASIFFLQDNGRSNYEANFYVYAAILTLSAITVMALNTAGIISLSMTAGIAMHAAAALLLLSMIFKAAYKVYNGEKKHLLTTAALTVGLATMALSIVHIYDIAVINEIQAIVTHPAALIAPLAIMAIAAVLITALSPYKKIVELDKDVYNEFTTSGHKFFRPVSKSITAYYDGLPIKIDNSGANDCEESYNYDRRDSLESDYYDMTSYY